MATVKKLTGRGATGVVEAHGEVIFGPTTDFGRWKIRLASRIRGKAAYYAPSNKRARWAHSGVRLKDSMTSDVTFRRTKGGGRAYSGVGSKVNHAMYVDQGTGIHGGGGPFEIKMLPPWHAGSPSLFESTWRPGPGKRPVGTMMNPGQEGQFFFDRALGDSLAGAGIKTVRGDSGSLVRTMFPETLFTHLLGLNQGPTATPGFMASLTEWRAWRDAAWRARVPLGERGALTRDVMRRLEAKRRHEENLLRRKEIKKTFSKDTKRRKRKERDARRKAEQAKSLKKDTAEKKPKKNPLANAQRLSLQYMVKWEEHEREQARAEGRPPRAIDSPPSGWGFWVKRADGTRMKIYWPVRIADAWAEGGYQHKSK